MRWEPVTASGKALDVTQLEAYREDGFLSLGALGDAEGDGNFVTPVLCAGLVWFGTRTPNSMTKSDQKWSLPGGLQLTSKKEH